MVVQSSAKQSDGTYQITYIMHEALLHKYPEFKDVFKAGMQSRSPAAQPMPATTAAISSAPCPGGR